jgi:hypothetical protein
MADEEKVAASKVAVTISRHWHEPQIHTVVSGEGIAMAILLNDYVKALTLELYAEGRWWSREQLEFKVQQAAKRVLDRIKEESAKVV